MHKYLLALVISLLSVAASAEREEFHVVIKNHRFSPAEIHVPANSLLWLVLENKDASSEEFESLDLHREKIIAPGKTAKIKIGPLKEGAYRFMGAFNPQTAQGVVIAK
ncbi:MAG: cupredoxin domain-containing protein [Gammaproteobacteria bacterium]|nr:cupredoxin domain-containing protein [Gammaproteobacteria bacterium]MBQ0840167.1 cupredoxin domain-containing protein [Gammaproteobacteria bacterium]